MTLLYPRKVALCLWPDRTRGVVVVVINQRVARQVGGVGRRVNASDKDAFTGIDGSVPLGCHAKWTLSASALTCSINSQQENPSDPVGPLQVQQL